MSEQSNVRHVHTVLAHPGALGLFGLAVATFVVATQMLGWTGGEAKNVTLALPWIVLGGAVAQLIAGAVEFKHNNTFGATSFFLYGFFWLGIAVTDMITHGLLGQVPKAGLDLRQLGVVAIGYLIVTIFMTITAMSANKVTFFVYAVSDLLFLCLALNLVWEVSWARTVAGWAVLVVSLTAFYAGGGALLHGHTGEHVLPMGAPFGPWAPKSEAQGRETVAA